MKPFRYIIGLLLAPTALTAMADAPAGYYSSLNGLRDGDLKTATYNLVRNFTLVSSYSDLPRYFQRTDVYPQKFNGRTRWWDMYSDIMLYAPSFSGLNREHSFPKSWWGGSTSVSAYVDLNHLYPSEMAANTAKSNYPLGMVDTSSKAKFDNGICKVGYPVNGQGGGATFVFEPDDEYKGDFARTYFYMATCYQNLTWKYTYMVSQNLYPTLSGWAVNLLLDWHRRDPVSQKERDRNDVVYSIQNNRNPFIDMPELAEYIWGTKKGEAFSPGSVIVTPTGDPELTAPTEGLDLDFGQVAEGEAASRMLYIHGKDLGGYVRAYTFRNDSKLFTVPSERIDATKVCTDEGYWLTIEYRPDAIGTHTTNLVIEGDFPEKTRGVTLRGECCPVPTLSACTATSPTDIQPDRYTANWTAPAGEVVDYFVVTRTMYAGQNVTTETLPAEENFLEITGFDQSDSESYSVQSARLGFLSPMSNVVFVDHVGLSGVRSEEPLIVQTFDGAGFVRFICSVPQSGCRIYDTAGRLVRYLPTVEQNMDVELPLGIYLIVTDTHTTPVRVAVR